MKRLLLAALLLLVPSIGWAQVTRTMPPMCTATTILTTCVPQVQGTIARITDATDATVCTNSGAGTTDVTCQFNGTSWGPMATIAVVGGTWTGAESETITNATDEEFTFTLNEDGTVTLMAVDTATPAHFLIDVTGAGTISFGSTDVTRILSNTNDIQLNVSTNDDTLGIHNIASSSSVILDFRDYGDTTDDDMAHGSIVVNCTTTSTGAEECDFRMNHTTAGGNVEIFVAHPAGAVEVGDPTTTHMNLTTDGLNLDIDAVSETASLRNVASGSVVLDFRDYGDTTDDDMAHAAIFANCTTTTSGAEDCDLTLQTTEAGATAVRMAIDGDGDVTFAPEKPDGGNATLNRRINGIPKIAGFSAGVGNDASETTNVDFGDSETPNTDWTQTANITTADDTTTWRKGSASLEMVVGATPSAGNGADNALATGDQNWSADESFGLWVYCTIVFNSGDWVLGITDNASEDVTTTFPAYGTANTWQWMELEIGSIADGDKDVITDIAIDLSTAGATTFAAGATCNFDGMWKWDGAEEMALAQDIYEDGILSMFSVITAGANITPILEVEDTDFFVHYETGNDFIVPVTDLSADSLWGMVALE